MCNFFKKKKSEILLKPCGHHKYCMPCMIFFLTKMNQIHFRINCRDCSIDIKKNYVFYYDEEKKNIMQKE